MLSTRLDFRSTDNDRLTIVNEAGEVIAEVIATSPNCSLKISTQEGLHIEKPNGFRSSSKQAK